MNFISNIFALKTNIIKYNKSQTLVQEMLIFVKRK